MLCWNALFPTRPLQRLPQIRKHSTTFSRQRTPVTKIRACDTIENNAHSPHSRVVTINNRAYNMQRPDAAAVIVRISF